MKQAIKHTAARMKGGFYAGLGLGAGLLTSGLFAAAAAMNIFSAGEVISAAKINQNFQIAAPEGAVMAFFRTDCPEGWAAADGNNGTPDLRGQFIRGRDDAGTGAAGRDPQGVRGVGGFQDDAFQGFAVDRLWITTDQQHNAYAISGVVQYFTATQQLPQAYGSYGNPRMANETRPKNVALTYCMRKN